MFVGLIGLVIFFDLVFVVVLGLRLCGWLTLFGGGGWGLLACVLGVYCTWSVVWLLVLLFGLVLFVVGLMCLLGLLLVMILFIVLIVVAAVVVCLVFVVSGCCMCVICYFVNSVGICMYFMSWYSLVCFCVC